MNRHAAREKAFQILFQLDMNDKQPQQAIWDHLESPEIDSFLKTLVEGVAEHKSAIDQTITEHMEKWTLNRVASVEKTLLRIAVYEIGHMDDIPVNVSINEAVGLARLYGDEQSGKFVNGVLSNIID